jgi:chromosome segregation ATPase
MKFSSGLRVSLLLLSGVVAAAGCDPSKPELDKTRQQLQAVTAERDNLKGQVEASEAKISSLQQQLTTLQAAATAKAEPEPAAAKGKGGKKKGKAAKHGKHR